jgi:hypothetical protein
LSFTTGGGSNSILRLRWADQIDWRCRTDRGSLLRESLPEFSHRQMLHFEVHGLSFAGQHDDLYSQLEDGVAR